MNDAYRPAIADYFDQLEAAYGDDFSFDRLSDEELLELERLGRHAIEQDEQVRADEKKALQPLLQLIDMQRKKRGIAGSGTQ
ncbi:MAG: hypothetical protein P8009_04020 [Gammaproteobacteria bacterium]